MIVQIYEIQTPEEAELCIQAGVDHLGSVVLSEEDWRLPGLKETLRVSRGTPAKNSLIPLFQTKDTLYRALDYYRPHLIHFCESLVDNSMDSPELGLLLELQVRIKEDFPEVKIMRSIPLPRNRTRPDFPTLKIAKELEPQSDFFLTDTWLEEAPVEGYIGITGKRCDVDLARDLVLQSEIPVILAGGLSPENVYETLGAVRPAGADSCTLTNQLDSKGRPVRFKKDMERVKRFVGEVRRAAGRYAKKG